MSPAPAAPPAADEREARAWQVLAGVQDPEIPVISIVDLGIVRHVRAVGDDLEVGVSPTYSGCPATHVIRASIEEALVAAGLGPVRVRDEISPPWTSDWLSEDGRRRLEAYGIAPPAEPVATPRALWRAAAAVRCPRCGSRDTRETSAFGSTPCKALYKCSACLEPFEYFKCI